MGLITRIKSNKADNLKGRTRTGTITRERETFRHLGTLDSSILRKCTLLFHLIRSAERTTPMKVGKVLMFITSVIQRDTMLKVVHLGLLLIIDKFGT